MPDVFSKAKRSEVMSRIRSRGNRDTELAFAKLLRANGITGWRRHALVRVAVEQSSLRSAPPRSSWLSRLHVASPRQGVERKRTSPRPSPRRGEGDAHSGPQPSTFNPQLAVRPDFVFRKSRTAIFVDGCFWHDCPKHCKYAKWLMRYMAANNPASPKSGLRRTGRAFWLRKLAGNKTRDRVVNRALRRAGWRVLRIWEHELAKKNEARLVQRIHRQIR